MKRIISLILVILMLGTALASCSDTSDVDELTDTTYTSEATTDLTETAEQSTEAVTERIPVMLEYDLTKFKIIYQGSDKLKYAEELSQALESETGIKLPIAKSADEKEGELEMIIGESSREISKRTKNEYGSKYLNCKGAVCDNGKVQLLGDDSITVRSSIEYFIANAVKKGETKITLPDVGDMCVAIDLGEIGILSKAEPSYLRIISNNIRLQSLTKSRDRAASFYAAVKLMDADIYALQEADKLWTVSYGLDAEMKEMGYEKVPVPKNEYGATSTNGPIYYRAERFKLVGSGYAKYDKSAFTDGAYPDANYLWCCLEEKGSGKKVVVANTHLSARVTQDGVSEEEKLIRVKRYRAECARQLSLAATALENKFRGAVVFCTGDYNDNYESDTYKNMKAGLFSAREECEQRENMQYNTSMGSGVIGVAPAEGTKAIDHIFYSKKGVSAKLYKAVMSEYAYAYSDHVPMLLDVVLK